jgi:hypothetical protein
VIFVGEVTKNGSFGFANSCLACLAKFPFFSAVENIHSGLFKSHFIGRLLCLLCVVIGGTLKKEYIKININFF